MKRCVVIRIEPIKEASESEEMGDTADITDVEDGGKMCQAKEFTRRASKKVVKVSKATSKRTVVYTRTSIDSIASALPDPEIMLVAIMAVTVFIRAEEAHLKQFCYNDGSVGWICTAMGCCIVAFSKYTDTRSMIHAFSASFIYLLIQVSLNYPPLGCLFTNVVVGDDELKSYTTETRSFAIIQAVVMIIFVVVYTVVIYRKRIGEEQEEVVEVE